MKKLIIIIMVTIINFRITSAMFQGEVGREVFKKHLRIRLIYVVIDIIIIIIIVLVDDNNKKLGERRSIE